MKKLKLLALLPALMLCSCGNGNTTQKPKTYTFNVKGFYYAYLTSEVQELTQDILIADCVSPNRLNKCFVEVPYGYEHRKTLELYYIGYIKTYTFDTEHNTFVVNNNGWELYI